MCCAYSLYVLAVRLGFIGELAGRLIICLGDIHPMRRGKVFIIHIMLRQQINQRAQKRAVVDFVGICYGRSSVKEVMAVMRARMN
jgi:hypothetical protein